MRGGEVIGLVSDLGGGKTTFVRGLANGIDSKDNVHSPSFTLSNEYHGAKLTLHHFDFYRLSEAGIMRDELAEVLAEPRAIVAVEWGEIVEDVLPKRKITIKIQATGDTTRDITMTYPAELNYLKNNT